MRSETITPEPPNIIYQFAQEYVAPWVKRYARLNVIGEDNLPSPGQGAILACNHSGSFWWDALCLVSALSDRRIHFIAHHWDATVPWIRKMLDLVDCCFLDECADDIDHNCEVVSHLKAGQQMCIYPEESYHSFRERYTLFKFSPHVAHYAKAAGVPIIPVTIIGAEEAAPTLIGRKKSKVPLHIPFHLPFILPVKVTVEIGEAIYPSVMEGESILPIEEQVRHRIYRTLSKYRQCRLSDEKYIDRNSWF